MTETSTAFPHHTQGCDTDRLRRRLPMRRLAYPPALASWVQCPASAKRAYEEEDGHDASGFAASLTGVSEHTRARTRTTSTSSSRGASAAVARTRPSSTIERCAVTSRICRRGFGKATISRKAASVHAYVRIPAPPRCGRTRHRGASSHRARSEEAAARSAPRRCGRDARPGRRRRRTVSDRDDPRATRDVALLELLYGAGLRVSECCGLDVDSVDLRKGTITVLGKGSKGPPAPARPTRVRRGRRLRGAALARRWSEQPRRPCS